MITPAALMAASVSGLMDTHVSACVRATMSFVPSLMNITFIVCLDCRVEVPNCRLPWMVKRNMPLTWACTLQQRNPESSSDRFDDTSLVSAEDVNVDILRWV